MTVHRIADDADTARHRVADGFSPRRFAFMRRLLDVGPSVVERGEAPAPHDCQVLGWVDWIRDGNGRVVYGDRRYILTAAGRAKVLEWIHDNRS